MAHCKRLGLRSIPDALTCTSMPQRWSIPRERKIELKEIQDILVKKPKVGATYKKFIKSTLYSPSDVYCTMMKENFDNLKTKPWIASILPRAEKLACMPLDNSKFGKVLRGSILSYQQKLSEDYVINDFSCTNFPTLPLDSAETRFDNSVSTALTQKQQAYLDALSVTKEASLDIQEKTVTQSRNDLWHVLRRKRITASKFGLVARWVRDFENLIKQLNPSRHVVTAPMRRGIELEPKAAIKAKGGSVNLSPSGLIIHPKCPWPGCSPDRKVYDLQALQDGYNPVRFLEIKVMKEGETDFANVSYLTKDAITNEYTLKKTHIYFCQVQCLLALTGLEWCDFFSYISDDLFVCVRISFDRIFFSRSQKQGGQFLFSTLFKSI